MLNLDVCLRPCFMTRSELQPLSSLHATVGEKRDIFIPSTVVCSANSCEKSLSAGFSIVFSHKGESEASPAGGSDPERLTSTIYRAQRREWPETGRKERERDLSCKSRMT